MAKPHPSLAGIFSRLMARHFLLPALVMLLAAFCALAAYEVRITSRTNDTLAAAIGESIRARLQESVDNIATLAQFRPTTQTLRLEMLIHDSLRLIRHFDTVALLDEAGTIRAASDPALVGLDYSGIRASMKPTSALGTLISPPYFSSRTRQVTVNMAHETEDGGMVLGILGLSGLHEEAQLIANQRPGLLIMVSDSFGNLIQHPDIGLVERQVNVAGLNLHTGLRRFDDAQAALASPQRRAGWLLVNEIVCPPLGWKVLVMQQAETVFGSIFAGLAVFLGLILALSAFLGWRFKRLTDRRILAPIADLAASISRMSAGQVEPAPSHDKPGPSFKEMERLRESFASLRKAVLDREQSLGMAHSDMAEQRNFLRGLLNALPLAVFVMNPEHGRLSLWNAAAGAMFGLPAFSDDSRDPASLLPTDLAGHLTQAAERVGNTRSLVEVSSLTVHSAGSGSRHLRVRVSAVREKDGKTSAILAVCEDVTVQREAEDQIRFAQAHLADIVDSMPSALIGVDDEGRVTLWNKKAQADTGLPQEQALGRLATEAYPELDDEAPFIRAALKQRKYERITRRMAYRDGEHHEEITLYPIASAGGSAAVIRIDDVTQREQLQELMIQSEKMLSLGGLAAGMAHELNNPLGIIMQSAQSVERRVSPNLPANRRDADETGLNLAALQAYMARRGIDGYLKNIHEAGERASQIIRTMLDFSRTGNTSHVACALTSLADTAVTLAAGDYDLKKKYDFRKIRIEKNYAAEDIQALCTQGEIIQVLLNILKNAAQALSGHTPEPVIRITTSAVDGMARLTIEDNGPGMDETTRRRVFEPFFTTKGAGEGTGLGLSLSYFIVAKKHAGRITLDTAPGQGCRFTIELPSSNKEKHR